MTENCSPSSDDSINKRICRKQNLNYLHFLVEITHVVTVILSVNYRTISIETR